MAFSIPVVCVNPDVTCMHGDAIRYTAGYFAKQYSDRHGCEVYYYGKPYDNIYKMAFRKARASKDRILAIGDTIETDILGANNNGVDFYACSFWYTKWERAKRKIQHSTARVYHRFFACIEIVLCPKGAEMRGVLLEYKNFCWVGAAHIRLVRLGPHRSRKLCKHCA